MDATPASHPAMVLVVEDHEDSREMYCRCLELAGYSTLGAANGREALTAAQTYRPNIIVTDIGMPGMDGWDLATAIRQDDRTRDIGIIAVSGWATNETPQRNPRPTVDVILMKPCLPDELLREVRKLLARGRLARLKSNATLAKANDLRRRSGQLIERSAKHARNRNRGRR